MLVPPCEFNDLRDLRFGYLVGENAAYTHAVTMDMEHDLDGILAPLVEDLLKNVDDELHGRVVVVEDEDLIEARFLGLGARFRDDAGARAVSRALLAAAIVPRVSHAQKY